MNHYWEISYTWGEIQSCYEKSHRNPIVLQEISYTIVFQKVICILPRDKVSTVIFLAFDRIKSNLHLASRLGIYGNSPRFWSYKALMTSFVSFKQFLLFVFLFVNNFKIAGAYLFIIIAHELGSATIQRYVMVLLMC